MSKKVRFNHFIRNFAPIRNLFKHFQFFGSVTLILKSIFSYIIYVQERRIICHG